MMNQNIPPGGGGQNPQSRQWLMSLLQALFGGQLGQGGGMPGGMGEMGMGGGMSPSMQPPGLPKMGMGDPTVKGPTADMPPAQIGQGPYADFRRGLPKQGY